VSDRLTDLQRQRALAHEQVAWFDREIARESGQAAAATGPAPAAVPAAVPMRPAASDQAAARAAEEIIAQYERPAGSAVSDVKRGCYLYFAAALGAVVLLAVTAYLAYTHRR